MLNHIVLMGRLTRDRIGSDIHLVINTGEMGSDDVRALKDSGFTMSYHVVRLREGVDTGHSVDMRMRTIENVLKGGLELQYLIEPLGPEHSAAEILIEARRARAVGALQEIVAPVAQPSHPYSGLPGSMLPMGE